MSNLKYRGLIHQLSYDSYFSFSVFVLPSKLGLKKIIETWVDKKSCFLIIVSKYYAEFIYCTMPVYVLNYNYKNMHLYIL